MNPRDFLTLALALLGQPTEAAWRSALSRASCAAFHVARDLLVRLGFGAPPTDQAQDYLSLRLQNTGDPTVNRTGAVLSTLYRSQNYADYHLQRPFSQAFARAQVQAVEQTIQALDAVAADPTRRTQITAEMIRYERDVLHDVTWQP
jgi:hypothetical protein